MENITISSFQRFSVGVVLKEIESIAQTMKNNKIKSLKFGESFEIVLQTGDSYK